MKRAWSAALLLLLGCTGVPARVGEPAPKLPDAQAEASYRQTVDRYTTQREVYKLFDTRMFVAVTHQAWPFREARTRRLGAFQVWPEPLLAEKLAMERAEADSTTEFFMGVHMNDRTHEDFDRKNSIWRIALVTPSGEVTPTKVERVGRSTLDMRALYPYMDDFWVGYRILFPKPQVTGDRVMLRIASTIGKAELEFPAQ